MPLRDAWTTTRNTLKKVPRTIGRLVKFCLKKVKLQILPQLLKWKQDKESAKVVLYKDRGYALLDILPHLVPLAGSLTLIAINTQTLFIGNLSTSAVTAFQFAAKLLELTIQASLTTILLQVIRWQAVNNCDLPLGTLLAPLRTIDVSYLWSLELWGAVTAKRWLGRRKLLILPLILSSVLLAALVGPAGAVLMVPRQIDYLYGRYLTIVDPQDVLFPPTMSYFDGTRFESGMQQVDRYFGNGPWPLVEGDGIRTFAAPRDTGLSTIAVVTPVHIEELVRTRGANLVPGSAIPSTLLATETRHPLVQIKCTANELQTYRNNDTYLDIPAGNPEIQSLVTWKDCLERAGEDNKILFFHELSPSLVPRHSTFMVFGTTAPVDRDNLATVDVCLVDATWARVTLNGSQYNDYSPLEFLVKEHYNNNNSIPSSEIVHFPAAWTDRIRAAILNSSVLGTDHQVGLANLEPERIFALILSNSRPEQPRYGHVLEPDSRDTCCGGNGSTTLGSYLNVHHMYKHYLAISLQMYTNSVESYDPATLTYQVITQYQQGYGYDASDITVRLSLAVIALYCVFATVHIAVSLLTGFCGTSWDSVSELLMLGLMSRAPSHLTHVSVGIETLKTFGEPVSVRVRDAAQAVELVFEAEPGGSVGRTRVVAMNQAY